MVVGRFRSSIEQDDGSVLVIWSLFGGMARVGSGGAGGPDLMYLTELELGK